MDLHKKEYSADALALFQRAKETMLAIPNYAEYYRDRILDARAKMEAEPDEMLRDDLYHRTMANAVGGFGILGMLPSPASVRVLGDFLSDERGRYTITPEDEAKGFDRIAWVKSVRTSNCEYAASSMTMLPLVDKPVGGDVTGYAAVGPWREWYERIKSGRATFRFEGDPVEYDLDGPASPEKLARIKANRERDTDREHRRSVSASDGGTPAATVAREETTSASRLPVLLAAALAAAAVGWFLIRRMRRWSP